MWGPVLPQWLGELLGEGNEGAMVAGREAAGWCPRIVLLCSCRQDRERSHQENRVESVHRAGCLSALSWEGRTGLKES